METFDSSGRVSPVGMADQGVVSKKISDKDSQGQGPRKQPQKKVASVQIPEREDGDSQSEDHVIDIIV